MGIPKKLFPLLSKFLPNSFYYTANSTLLLNNFIVMRWEKRPKGKVIKIKFNQKQNTGEGTNFIALGECPPPLLIFHFPVHNIPFFASRSRDFASKIWIPRSIPFGHPQNSPKFWGKPSRPLFPFFLSTYLLPAHSFFDGGHKFENGICQPTINPQIGSQQKRTNWELTHQIGWTENWENIYFIADVKWWKVGLKGINGILETNIG